MIWVFLHEDYVLISFIQDTVQTCHLGLLSTVSRLIELIVGFLDECLERLLYSMCQLTDGMSCVYHLSVDGVFLDDACIVLHIR